MALNNTAVTPVNRVRATDDVTERISGMITSNRMEVGDPLPSEQALSEMFGVSKRVVREALRALTAQGVVQTSQGKRAVIGDTSPVAIEAYFRFMQRMDWESIAELYELREVIEVAATVLAARRATDEDKSRAARQWRRWPRPATTWRPTSPGTWSSTRPSSTAPTTGS